MVQRVIHLDVHRTAFVLALCVTIVLLFLMVLPAATYFLFSRPHNVAVGIGNTMGGGATILLMPVIYFGASYILAAFSVTIFNLVAPRVGGIGMTVQAEVGPGDKEAGGMG